MNESEDTMRFRITIRGDGCELRGYVDADLGELADLAQVLKPYGVVAASPAPEDYNPFHPQQISVGMEPFVMMNEGDRLISCFVEDRFRGRRSIAPYVDPTVPIPGLEGLGE
jgi:hypothetical protein